MAASYGYTLTYLTKILFLLIKIISNSSLFYVTSRIIHICKCLNIFMIIS